MKTQEISKRLLLCGLFCSALGLAGCFGFSVPAPVVQTYRLDYQPAALDQSPLPVVLRLAPFGTSAVYDRESIVYRDGPYSVGTYYYHRWIANPSSLVADLLARDLSTSGTFRAVQHGATTVASDYDIAGDIEEFGELAEAGCKARIEVRILVTRTRGPIENRILLRKTFTSEQPCSTDSIESFVEAMSNAVAQVSEALQQDSYAAIALEKTAAPAAK